MVTHQLQVERRTGKVRRPETDVLPLCHTTNNNNDADNDVDDAYDCDDRCAYRTDTEMQKISLVSVQFEKAMIVTLDELVAAGHGDKQYQELFAEMYV